MTTDDLCIQRRTSFFSINIQTPQYRENEAQSSNFNRLDKKFIYVFVFFGFMEILQVFASLPMPKRGCLT